MEARKKRQTSNIELQTSGSSDYNDINFNNGLEIPQYESLGDKDQVKYMLLRLVNLLLLL